MCFRRRPRGAAESTSTGRRSIDRRFSYQVSTFGEPMVRCGCSVADAQSVEQRIEQLVVEMQEVGHVVGDLQDLLGLGRGFVCQLLKVLANRSGIQIQIQSAQAAEERRRDARQGRDLQAQQGAYVTQ